MPKKNATVKTKIENTLYDLMIRSTVDNVYLTDNGVDKPLADKLTEIITALNQKATQSDIDNSINSLVDGAPAAMDTLKELADAISNNKTVIDALNAAIGDKANSSDLLYTNTTPTVSAHGGIAAGTTFKDVKVTDMLTKILYPYVAPTVSASTSPSNGGVFEKGKAQGVTSVTVNVQKKSANITKVEVFDGSTSLGAKSGNDLTTLNNNGSATLTFSVSLSIATTKNLQVVVTDSESKTTSTKTGTFTFVSPYYAGTVSDGTTIDAATVTALTKRVEQKGNKKIGYTASNACIVFAYPSSYGTLASIIDPNGFNVTDTYTSSKVTLTGADSAAVEYLVYKTKAATTVSNFNITFNY